MNREWIVGDFVRLKVAAWHDRLACIIRVRNSGDFPFTLAVMPTAEEPMNARITVNAQQFKGWDEK
jgi:hypothetical protein